MHHSLHKQFYSIQKYVYEPFIICIKSDINERYILTVPSRDVILQSQSMFGSYFPCVLL